MCRSNVRCAVLNGILGSCRCEPREDRSERKENPRQIKRTVSAKENSPVPGFVEIDHWAAIYESSSPQYPNASARS